MNTKLTLTIEQDVIQKAKDYARQKNRSLSDIIENYLKSLTKEESKEKKAGLTPIVKSLKGSFKMPANFDYKEETQKEPGKKISVMEKVLIDTDVILDFFFGRQPFVESATEIFLLCENQQIQGFATPVIISNVYYLLRKTAKHEIIIEKLKQLLNIIDIAEMNKEVVIDALNSKFKDFEDALQNFAAIHNGEIKILITRNVKDFQKSNLAVLTPEMYLKK